MALFNEVNLSNLFETILYSSSACEALSDCSIDLTDYCVRQLTYLMSSEEDDGDDDKKEKKTISR